MYRKILFCCGCVTICVNNGKNSEDMQKFLVSDIAASNKSTYVSLFYAILLCYPIFQLFGPVINTFDKFEKSCKKADLTYELWIAGVVCLCIQVCTVGFFAYCKDMHEFCTLASSIQAHVKNRL